MSNGQYPNINPGQGDMQPQNYPSGFPQQKPSPAPAPPNQPGNYQPSPYPPNQGYQGQGQNGYGQWNPNQIPPVNQPPKKSNLGCIIGLAVLLVLVLGFIGTAILGAYKYLTDVEMTAPLPTVSETPLPTVSETPTPEPVQSTTPAVPTETPPKKTPTPIKPAEPSFSFTMPKGWTLKNTQKGKVTLVHDKTRSVAWLISVNVRKNPTATLKLFMKAHGKSLDNVKYGKIKPYKSKYKNLKMFKSDMTGEYVANDKQVKVKIRMILAADKNKIATISVLKTRKNFSTKVNKEFLSMANSIWRSQSKK